MEISGVPTSEPCEDGKYRSAETGAITCEYCDPGEQATQDKSSCGNYQ